MAVDNEVDLVDLDDVREHFQKRILSKGVLYMKEQYRELKEDAADEEKAIDETIERLCAIRGKFDPQKQDNLIEPAMGTYFMNFYNGIENILKRTSKEYYSIMPPDFLDFFPESGIIYRYNSWAIGAAG